MQNSFRLLWLVLLVALPSACHLVYTPDVQQGNLFSKDIDQKAIAQLRLGLTKEQVLALLGTPSVTSPFDHSRWAYVSTYAHRGEKMQVHTMSLFFNKDTLVRIEGRPFGEASREIFQQNQKYRVGYPANETEGDKSQHGKSAF